MPYDEKLAARVRDILRGRRGVSEKKMFGGLSFLVNGNLCCGVAHGNLVVRVGPDQYEKALSKPSARPMDFTGRALKGLVYVSPTGCRSTSSLKRWVEMGVEFARSLPKKS